MGSAHPEKPGAAAASVALVDQVSIGPALQVTPSSRSREQKGLVLISPAVKCPQYEQGPTLCAVLGVFSARPRPKAFETGPADTHRLTHDFLTLFA